MACKLLHKSLFSSAALGEDTAQLYFDVLREVHAVPARVVVAPDTFRGESTTFIPRAIWLALATPQPRVNDDVDDIVGALVRGGGDGSDCDATSAVAVMGFCYGGGKALRYAIEARTADASPGEVLDAFPKRF